MIKNLFIDLGDVLYEIDIKSTIEKYDQMREPGAPPVEFGKNAQNKWFDLLDTGQVEIAEFAEGLKSSYQLTGTIEQIKQIWMDLLIGVIPGRVEAISQLAKYYNLALLSNTSRFHFEYYYPQCKSLFDQMDHLFVSFEMGLRKPDSAIYIQALEKMGWKAEETLFADDSKINIESAQKVGIKTWWIEQHSDFELMVENLLEKR